MENENNFKNLILAMVLSVAVFMGWNYFFMPKTLPVKNNKVSLKEKNKNQNGTTDNKSKSNKEDKNLKPSEPVTGAKINYDLGEKFVFLENDKIKIKFSTYGASLISLNLKGKKYTLDKEKKEQIYIIKEKNKNHYPFSFGIYEKNIEYLKNYAPFEISSKDNKSVEFKLVDEKFEIIKKYTLEKDYFLKLEIKIKNISNEKQIFKTKTMFSSFYDHRVEKTSIFGKDGKTFFYKTVHGDFERIKFEDFKKSITKKELAFTGFDDRYFIALIKPSEHDTFTFKIFKEVIKKDQMENMRMEFASEDYSLDAGKSLTLNYQLYNGPKILENLKVLGANDGIDYGIFAVISRIILWLLLFLYGIFKNYGIALIVLTLLVKLALYPLTKSSYVSMHKMKDLKPELDKLKEKFGDDRERMGRETMALYKKHGVSPLGGCLPMLLQMPIWFGLYRAIQYSVELYNEPFMLWIQDLSVADPYYILPFTMGILMFLQQKLTSGGMDQMQAKVMLYTMPVLFTFFMISLPSGLVLYIWVNTLVSIIQQQYINKKLDTAKKLKTA